MSTAATAEDHPQAATTRRHLGELGVMSAQVERAERQILAHAENMHADVQAKIKAARSAALTGGGDEYTTLVAERGRLERVIAQARATLAPRT